MAGGNFDFDGSHGVAVLLGRSNRARKKETEKSDLKIFFVNFLQTISHIGLWLFVGNEHLGQLKNGIRAPFSWEKV